MDEPKVKRKKKIVEGTMDPGDASKKRKQASDEKARKDMQKALGGLITGAKAFGDQIGSDLDKQTKKKKQKDLSSETQRREQREIRKKKQYEKEFGLKQETKKVKKTAYTESQPKKKKSKTGKNAKGRTGQ